MKWVVNMDIIQLKSVGVIWGLLISAYFIFSWWRAAQVVNRSIDPASKTSYPKSKFQFVGRGIRAVFFADDEEYFRLWDIVVIAFGSLGIAFSILYLLAKGGALEFLPFLRRIFGFKLFRIRRKKVVVDDTKV
jgi:hypothetical protein